MTIGSIIFNIVLTIFIYIFIPVIFLLKGKPISRRKMNIISVISLFIGIIISSVLVYLLSSGTRYGTGSGAIIWTVIGNILMRKKLALEDDPADIRFREKEERHQSKIDAAIQSGKYSSKEDMEKRHAIICLCIIAVIIIGFMPLMFLLRTIIDM